MKLIFCFSFAISGPVLTFFLKNQSIKFSNINFLLFFRFFTNQQHIAFQDKKIMPDSQIMTISIYIYTTNDFKILRYNEIDTCEDVCRQLCIDLNFTPIVQTLFSLRINGTQNSWLAGNDRLSPRATYDFRLRFKVIRVNELYFFYFCLLIFMFEKKKINFT